MKSQEGRNNFLWKGSRTLHFLMSLVKTPINTGSMLLSPLSSSTCFLLIAGGNLYDKILRQKDKLFEEEVIHLCGRKLELCLILAFWFCIYSFNNEECFSPFVQTPSRLWVIFMRKETSNKEAVYSCFLTLYLHTMVHYGLSFLVLLLHTGMPSFLYLCILPGVLSTSLLYHPVCHDLGTILDDLRFLFTLTTFLCLLNLPARAVKSCWVVTSGCTYFGVCVCVSLFKWSFFCF